MSTDSSTTAAAKPRPQGTAAGSTAAASAAAKPATTVRDTPARPATAKPDAGRRVKLTLSRVDMFSVLKISFLLSVALGIAGVVAVTVLWGMLSSMGVFSTITESVNQLQAGASATGRIDVADWFSYSRVLALSVVIGIMDVILLTAISTLTAFIYNLCAALVGGVQLTLTDD